MKLVSTLTAAAALALVAGAANADIVAQWNFNGDSSATVPGGGSTPSTAVGTGSASLVGGPVGSFASGISNGGSTDPVTTSPANFGWGTTTYPAASANNETAGAQFLVSTVGFEDIGISWDQRHSNTSSRFWAFLYTTDGTNWNRLFLDNTNANPGTTAGAAFGANGTLSGPAGDTWFNNRSVNLSSLIAVDDNANFGFRIVSSFDSGTSYAASNGASSYATTGTARFDMVTIRATAIPAPGSVALLGLGSLIAIRRNRV